MSEFIPQIAQIGLAVNVDATVGVVLDFVGANALDGARDGGGDPRVLAGGLAYRETVLQLEGFDPLGQFRLSIALGGAGRSQFPTDRGRNTDDGDGFIDPCRRMRWKANHVDGGSDFGFGDVGMADRGGGFRPKILFDIPPILCMRGERIMLAPKSLSENIEELARLGRKSNFDIELVLKIHTGHRPRSNPPAHATRNFRFGERVADGLFIAERNLFDAVHYALGGVERRIVESALANFRRNRG